MKILNERPPEWIMQGCMNQFRVNVESTFWTYGSTIYNPGGIKLPEHIIAHEETHAKQQEEFVDHSKFDGMTRVGDPNADIIPAMYKGKDAWWRRYLSDPRFRLEQEAEAYGRQFAFVCDHNHNRDQRAKFLFELGSHLSGPLYQVAVSPLQAREMIAVLAGQKELAV